jgi:hypothetical protein
MGASVVKFSDLKGTAMNEIDQTQARDIFHLLSFIVENTKIGLSDGAKAALGRLKESVKTEAERDTHRLEALKDRRSYLIPQRGRLAEYKRSHDFTAQNPGPMANARMRAEAKARAIQTAAQYDACCKELADVEAAIAAATKPEAA